MFIENATHVLLCEPTQAAIGGLKSTFTTSYFHTVIVYIICCVFMFKVFMPNGWTNGIDDVGAPGCVHVCTDGCFGRLV